MRCRLQRLPKIYRFAALLSPAKITDDLRLCRIIVACTDCQRFTAFAASTEILSQFILRILTEQKQIIELLIQALDLDKHRLKFN